MTNHLTHRHTPVQFSTLSDSNDRFARGNLSAGKSLLEDLSDEQIHIGINPQHYFLRHFVYMSVYLSTDHKIV